MFASVSMSMLSPITNPAVDATCISVAPALAAAVMVVLVVAVDASVVVSCGFAASLVESKAAVVDADASMVVAEDTESVPSAGELVPPSTVVTSSMGNVVSP
jgi:hypothetical protein